MFRYFGAEQPLSDSPEVMQKFPNFQHKVSSTDWLRLTSKNSSCHHFRMSGAST